MTTNVGNDDKDTAENHNKELVLAIQKLTSAAMFCASGLSGIVVLLGLLLLSSLAWKNPTRTQLDIAALLLTVPAVVMFWAFVDGVYPKFFGSKNK